jgi:hypothetical protein
MCALLPLSPLLLLLLRPPRFRMQAARASGSAAEKRIQQQQVSCGWRVCVL